MRQSNPNDDPYYDADNDPYLEGQNNMETEGPLLKNNRDLPIAKPSKKI